MSLRSYTWRTFGREIGLMILAAIWWIPFYFLVSTSLKSNQEALRAPIAPPSRLLFSNFPTAWRGQAGLTLGTSLINSVVITAGTVVALIILGSICSYAIARRGGKLGNALYILFVVGIVLPFQLAIIPIYTVFLHFDLVSSLAGMILMYAGLLMPLTVFFYTGFIRVMPRDYEEAAQVDGAGHLTTFLRIVFPLLSPITGSVAILTGLIVWNDFFLQLVFLSGSPHATLPVAIFSFVGAYQSQWNLIFAAVVISIVPVLAFYLVAQRQLIRGFTGGIKG